MPSREETPVRTGRSISLKLAGVLMIAPAVIFMAAVLGYPIVQSFVMSFFQYSLAEHYPFKFFGLSNFIELIRLPHFQRDFLVSTKYTVIAVATELVLGFAVALSVFRQTRWSRMLRSAYIIPMVITPVAAGILWRFLYNPDVGVIDFLLTRTGLISKPVLFLGTVSASLPSLIVVEIWQATPFVALVIMAGLSALPTEPFDAAVVDGASALQVFRFITLPLLRPIILIILILRSMDAFRAFDLVYVMTKGGPAGTTETLTYYAYQTAFEGFDIGAASAMAYIITIVVLLMSIVLIRTLHGNPGDSE